MLVPRHALRRLRALAAIVVLASLSLTTWGGESAEAAAVTTAWQNGQFAMNTAGVVSESDVVLGSPNSAATQSLPLGNGALGAAVWAANGFTAQLNRNDTFPDRKSPGWVQIPGLAAMTGASDFSGTLDLYNGVLSESGGGMAMKAWVASNKDELIVDVTGANPNVQQTATVNLWSGRTPAAAATGATGTLAETWADSSGTGASGQTFGSLAAITAGGQGTTASVVNSQQVQVSFRPNADGSFRVIVAAPTWKGGDANATATNLIGSDATATESSLMTTQSAWWNGFWANSGLVKMTSSDGTAQYMENLRTIYLYLEAASMRGAYPGSQAGVGNLFNWNQDVSDWYPSGYWLWNLRGQIAANMSSGNFSLNIPIFKLYLDNLSNIQNWTQAQMGGTPGACVPETMRFNGNGWYAGGTGNASCSQASSPSYNALTLTSGAELGLFIWQQYQDTGDINFLRTYYPLMQQAATFLLDYHPKGSDGYLHATSNAHETQWAVTDPTTDIAAMSALFPATVSAAHLLGTDSTLASQLQAAESQIPPYARTDEQTKQQLLTASADSSGTDVIADSYQPAAALHNSENIGLEPVWPYGLITDNSSLTALAVRTFNYRPNVDVADWSFDAVQAARLGMASAVQSNLVTLTQNNQNFINGMANPFGKEPYIEHVSTVALAVNEALVQDYDGVLRIAPAWPSGWDASGTVYIQDGSKVDVQVEGGTPVTVAIHAGTTETMQVRNPWPGQSIEVVNGSTGAVVVGATTAATVGVPVSSGQAYLVERTSSLTTSLPFAQVTGTQATASKHLGPVSIGIGSISSSGVNCAASVSGVVLGRAGWVVSTNTAAAGADAAGNAVDGSLSTRFSSDAVQAPGQYWQVNLGSPQSFGVLQMQVPNSANDYARGYQVQVSADGVSWSTVASCAGTGDPQVVSFPAQRAQYVRVTQTGSSSVNYWSIDELNLYGSGEAPFGGTAAAVPGTVQAANYDTGGQGVAYNVTSVNGSANSYRPDGVDLETCTDTGCGYDVGWSSAGQWFRYTVNVASAGSYTVSLRVAAPSAVGSALHLATTTGTNLSGAIAIPATGGWQTWATVTATVTLPAGQQTLVLAQDNAGWNLHSLAFASAGLNTAAWYQVINQATGSCVDDSAGGTANGTIVQQWACGTGNYNQQWQFRTASTGYYSVLNRNAATQNEVWDVTGGPSATAPGTKVQTWSYGAGTNQQWQPVSVGNGYYKITVQNSGLCLEVPAGATANGTQLDVNTCNGTTNQNFKLVQQP
jgi:hypothetical protein